MTKPSAFCASTARTTSNRAMLPPAPRSPALSAVSRSAPPRLLLTARPCSCVRKSCKHAQHVESGEVTLGKEVVEERKTLQVPVTREEVYVERHAVDRPADRPIEAGAGRND